MPHIYLIYFVRKIEEEKEERLEQEAGGAPPQAISNGRGPPPQAISKGRGPPPARQEEEEEKGGGDR